MARADLPAAGTVKVKISKRNVDGRERADRT